MDRQWKGGAMREETEECEQAARAPGQSVTHLPLRGPRGALGTSQGVAGQKMTFQTKEEPDAGV